MSSKVKKWIVNHDDSNLFLFLYISLAVILSIAISLFWLVVVVLIHFIFECIKQHELKKGFKGILIRSSWELLLDFGLIFFALVIALYMDIILGAAGIGAGARAGAQTLSKAGARFAGWQRAIRGILLSLDDVAQLTKFNKKEDTVAKAEITKYGGWTSEWGKGDKITISFTILSSILILISPLITDYSINEVLVVILDDLKPLP